MTSRSITFYIFIPVILLLNGLISYYIYASKLHLILKVILSSLLVLVLLLLCLRFNNKKYVELKKILKEYSKGNFLIASRKSKRTKTQNEIELILDNLRKQMQYWLHNVLYSKVKIQDYAKTLNTNTKSTLESINEISSAINSININSTKASEDTNENAAIAEELLSSNIEVSENYFNFSNITQEAADKIILDSNKIENTLEHVSEIQKIMTKATEEINNLNIHLNSIFKMSDAIAEIAEQTNLLSLNASIEAARAGEAGRGFSVVAAEIKKLAEQSEKTTNDIKGIVELIENSIGKVIEEISVGSDKSLKIQEESKEASKSLKDITIKITEMSRFINNISENMKEQSSATEALAKNVETSADFISQLNKTINEIDTNINNQVKKEKENLNTSNYITEIANKFSQFTKTFEKEIDKELLATCEKIAHIEAKGLIDNSHLKELAAKTGISEIYVTNEQGVTEFSNNPAGIGFKFSNDPNSQSYEFSKILSDPSIKICQEMQIRDLDGKYYKFAGVSKIGKKGIIQVGLHIDDLLDFKGQYALD